MNDIIKAIIGGLSIVGLSIVGYRTYEVVKLRKEIREEEIIEIQPEPVKEPQKK